MISGRGVNGGWEVCRQAGHQDGRGQRQQAMIWAERLQAEEACQTQKPGMCLYVRRGDSIARCGGDCCGRP